MFVCLRYEPVEDYLSDRILATGTSEDWRNIIAYAHNVTY